jgi:hypothetical protein
MTDESKVCEHCFGTGQKVEMRPVRLGAKLAPFEPCLHCTAANPSHRAAPFISRIVAARRKRRP